MLENLTVLRSSAARSLFLGSAALSLAVFLLAAHLSELPASAGLTSIFRELFTSDDRTGAICALLILVVAAMASSYALPVRSFLHWIGTNPGSVAAGVLVVLMTGSCLVYQNVRLSMDEYSQYFQSQIFAAGHLSGQFPVPLVDWLVPLGFQGAFLNVSHTSGSVAALYWPSFSLLMTPFTWFGISWACNPLIGAVTILTLHRLALRIFHDAESAGLVILLTVASPVFFGNGISYYAMSAHLLANCAFALLLIDAAPRRAFGAGLIGSIALTLHNPIPHLVFAAPWIISAARRDKTHKIFLALLAGYIPLCGLLGFGWFFFSHQLGHEAVTLTSGAGGIGQIVLDAKGFASTPSATLVLARIVGLAKTWVWSVPGLLLLAGYGAWKWRHDRNIALLAISALLTFGFYFVVPWDQGHGWGYRYFHSAWLALPLLAAAAFAHNSEDRILPSASTADTQCFIVVCALLTLFGGVGLRAYQMYAFISAHESQAPLYEGAERRVEILDVNGTFYGADLIQNDPWLRGKVIRMITHGAAADADMMHENFPDMHPVYHDRYGSVWSAK
jgi:hypothetical protein